MGLPTIPNDPIISPLESCPKMCKLPLKVACPSLRITGIYHLTQFCYFPLTYLDQKTQWKKSVNCSKCNIQQEMDITCAANSVIVSCSCRSHLAPLGRKWRNDEGRAALVIEVGGWLGWGGGGQWGRKASPLSWSGDRKLIILFNSATPCRWLPLLFPSQDTLVAITRLQHSAAAWRKDKTSGEMVTAQETALKLLIQNNAGIPKLGMKQSDSSYVHEVIEKQTLWTAIIPHQRTPTTSRFKNTLFSEE